MNAEIKNLIENSKNPEGLARIFERIAERCREPLIFTDNEVAAATDEPTAAPDQGGVDGR